MPDYEKLQAKALPFLTKASQISGPFITTFLLIHLAAPVSANLGGSSASTSTMLLGREYYQTAIGEPLLLLAPLGVHMIAGPLRRYLSPPGKPPRPWTHLLSLTGYSSLLFFFPIHYGTHRSYPAYETPSIDSVGPSELSYEFVKTGLKTWPIRSWLLYGGLILGVTLHMADGIGIIWNNLVKHDQSYRSKSQSRRTKQALALLGVALPVLSGIYFLSQESFMTFPSMIARYKAAFLESYVYQL
ncbi:hypothetical protein CVT24_006704 [Panaeolus cyanescens]|uniref:Mitochondrial adapter protein MCP1 transmembrane domain-containing protein n=1 Tax=Panaeolus cyanescens TaxID=181874 RepID=A0A409V9E9_9AGAR|nr:hypothetical protein CVT24_006704 [Panaeolus cyanescens]